MTMKDDLQTVTRLAEDGAEMLAAGQKAVLGVLMAEMSALGVMLPGAAAQAPPDEARLREIDAEVEASFDNMPV